MSDVAGKFCPVCGQARPTIVSKRVHLTKNQRYRCEACTSEFTIHVDESENQTARFLRHVAPDGPRRGRS